MTWTYSGDPSDSDNDAVRFTVGDTETLDQLIQDEEISYLLTTHGSVLAASIAAAEAIAAKFARLVDEVSGDLVRKCSVKAKHFKELANQLKDRASDLTFNAPIPFAGGVSKSDIQNRELDTNRFPDTFNVGETDHEDANNESFLRTQFPQS